MFAHKSNQRTIEKIQKALKNIIYMILYQYVEYKENDRNKFNM